MVLPRISVLSGENVLAREFAYVDNSLRNRGAFVRALRSEFPSVRDDEEFSSTDLCQLCRFVSTDFPEQVVKEGMLALGHGAADTMPYGKFRSKWLVWYVNHGACPGGRGRRGWRGV